MLIRWRVPYFDRTDKKRKERILFLDTGTLPAAERGTVERVVEWRSRYSDREFVTIRGLFLEVTLCDLLSERFQSMGKTKTFVVNHYHEDETGSEISLPEMWHLEETAMRGTPMPAYALKPVRVEGISLTQEEVRLLGCFTRDCKELIDSAFMEKCRGRFSAFAGISTSGVHPSDSETALNDHEIRSFVTVFRRLYVESEPASLSKAMKLFARVLGDHPQAELVSAFDYGYKSHLAFECERPPGVKARSWNIRAKRLIDVFIGTQYAREPDDTRQRQFNDCLAQVQGDRNVLTWLFLYELRTCSTNIEYAGRAISKWFQQYCDHHGINPDVLGSSRHQGIGQWRT